MRFGVLGPLSVTDAGREAAITAGRDRVVLAMLLLQCGRIVAVEDLIDAVWEDRPPATARGQLQTCVSRLRRTLGPDLILTDPAGYGIRCAPDQLDATDFTRMIAQARAVAAGGDAEAARKLFREALTLWRGPVLAGLEVRAVRQRGAVLDEQHGLAVEDRMDLELAGGRDPDLIAELTGLVEQFPLRERLRAQLMLALHRAGRQADALAEYRRIREHWQQELGIEPGAALQDLHRQILLGELTEPQSPAPGPAAVDSLPRAVGDFTGREQLTARLLATMDEAGALPAVRVIDGMAGSGKTTFAVHLAGLLRDRFPDAGLFVDLQGHSDQRPLLPEAALVTLLRQLGVPADQIPDHLDERIRLWRGQLATRRSIVVLDNAASTAQVLPLLPASGATPVLITSRRRLTGLDGVHPESLPVLDDAEAVALLERIVGARVAAEPEAALDVIRRCGRLPLAIRLAGARLAHRPRWRVADLLRRLGDAALPELAAEDRTVASAFALSYGQLPERTRRMFRLLGVHPGERFEVLAAAALADESLDEARDLLDDLLDAHLIEEPEPEVFRLHDLLREYAAALAAELSGADRRDAVVRLLDFHLHAFVAANDGPQREVTTADLRLEPPRRPDLTAALTDPAAHLERERPNLTAFVDAALAVDQPEWVWRLPRAAWRYLFSRGYVPELDVLLRRGMEAARQFADQATVAVCANYFASSAHRLGRRDESRALLELAIEICRELGDEAGMARSMGNLAVLEEAEGRFAEMVALQEASLRIDMRIRGDLIGVALRRAGIGAGHARLGRFGPALHNFRLRLLITVAMRDAVGTASSLHAIGMTKWRVGLATVATSRRMVSAALRLSRSAGYAVGEVEGLAGLARLEHAEGRTGSALELVEQAIEIAQRIGHRRYESLHRTHRGEFLLAVGDLAGARESCAEALRLARPRFPYECALALSGLAAVHLAEGDPGSARRLLEQALTMFARMGVPEREDVARRLAELDSGPDQLRTPPGGGRMEG
ncbi:AfsR/SARP family transcriptional regulator [Actinoplanes auranticolor]|uniref:SARP family transcriptional regulator n=1 Tax=Actinoplanes auranticolor TaxID=47988 RepID=A0A919VRW7_9ACTN|nr:BTAD domain-containing putative transcriptional regulator [Actinoplanes auranticolor]GIM73587.1 SARP family transcriptional regulator [Actinoplanes auranticolor]